MGAAAYNRGSGFIRRQADQAIPTASACADRHARNDEVARLREQIGKLERDLVRARRCISELRRSKDARMSEARSELNSAQLAISILCRLAFRVEEDAA
jgi:hypothetical protein